VVAAVKKGFQDPFPKKQWPVEKLIFNFHRLSRRGIAAVAEKNLRYNTTRPITPPPAVGIHFFITFPVVLRLTTIFPDP
jgi:hypothetical protein